MAHYLGLSAVSTQNYTVKSCSCSCAVAADGGEGVCNVPVFRHDGWFGLAVWGPCAPIGMPTSGYHGDSGVMLRRLTAALLMYTHHPASSHPTYFRLYVFVTNLCPKLCLKLCLVPCPKFGPIHMPAAYPGHKSKGNAQYLMTVFGVRPEPHLSCSIC